MEAGTPDSASSRGRLTFALGAALVLSGIVVAVLVLSGDEREQAASVPVPPRCVNAWNGDAAATSYGRHNFNFHQYTGARVTFLTDQGEEVGEEEGGRCAVVFPSRVLDPEPFAAGQVFKAGRWLPISSLQGVELVRVAELQAEAAKAPNTIVDATGKLSVG